MEGAPDVIAAEVQHRLSCYCTYALPDSLSTLESAQSSQQTVYFPAVAGGSTYDAAFQKVAAIVQSEILDTTDAVRGVTMTVLHQIFIYALDQDRVESDYQSLHLKHRLMEYFGDAVWFVWSSITESEVVLLTIIPDDSPAEVLDKTVWSSFTSMCNVCRLRRYFAA